MAVYCSISTYTQEKHPKFYDLAQRFCVNIEQYPLVVIPTTGELTSISKDSKTANEEKFREAQIRFMSYFIHAKPTDTDEDFKKNKEGTNGNRHKVKFAKVTSKGFVLHSGKDFKTTADCDFDPNFISPLSLGRGRSNQKMHKYVAFVKTGTISHEGIGKDEPIPADVEKMYGGDYATCESKNVDTKKHKFEKILNELKSNIEKGSNINPFVSVIAGLITCVKMGLEDKSGPNYDKYHRTCRLLKCLGSFDALGMYIVLFQPYGKFQFVPEFLTSEVWDGAEKAADSGDEYVKLYNSIDGLCRCQECCDGESMRETAKNDLTNNRNAAEVARNILGTYEKYAPKIFGDDLLDSKQKLWADEFLFRSYTYFESFCGDDRGKMLTAVERINALAQDHFRGDYLTDPLFANPSYWTNESRKDTLFGNFGPDAFVNSPFFLKCCFYSSPKCESYVRTCCNPISTKARAYFMINGGSFNL